MPKSELIFFKYMPFAHIISNNGTSIHPVTNLQAILDLPNLCLPCQFSQHVSPVLSPNMLSWSPPLDSRSTFFVQSSWPLTISQLLFLLPKCPVSQSSPPSIWTLAICRNGHLCGAPLPTDDKLQTSVLHMT